MLRPTRSLTTVLGLILLGVVLRIARDAGVIGLPPNVAPISALALFSGALLPRRWTFVVPLAAMLLSDLVIGFYSLPVMVSVYACFALSNVLGRTLRSELSIRRLVVRSLIGSGLFFLITNAAVWMFQDMYAHTLNGLAQSYLLALPYFRNTVFGDLGFTAAFFGIYHFVVVYLTKRHPLASSITNG